MGNNLYSKNQPKLESFNLEKKRKIKISEKGGEVKKAIRTYKFSQDNCYMYLCLENDSRILKYDIYENNEPSIYTSHANPVRILLLNSEDTFLLGIEARSIRIHHTHMLKEKCELHEYRQERIFSASLFDDDNFLMVLIEGEFQFDIFNLNTEIRETIKNTKKQNQKIIGFRSFCFNDIRKEFYLLDSTYLYGFNLKNHKETNRKYIFKSKDKKLLYVTKDGKKLFTAKENKICVRWTESFEKLVNFKIPDSFKFEDSQFEILNDERLLVIFSSEVYAIVVFDLLNFREVFRINLSYVESFVISNDCSFCATNDENAVYIFEIKREFNPKIVFKQTRRKMTLKKLSGEQKKENDERMEQANRLIKDKYYDKALLLLRKTTKIYGESKKSIFLTGKVLFCIEKYEKAIFYFEKSIHLSPKNENCFLWKGKCFYQLKMYKEAEEYFNKAVQLNPVKKAAFKNLRIAQKKLETNQNNKIEIDDNVMYPHFSQTLNMDLEKDFINQNNYDDIGENNKNIRSQENPHHYLNGVKSKVLKSEKIIQIGKLQNNYEIDYNQQNDQKNINDYDIDYNQQNDQKNINDYEIDYNKQNDQKNINDYDIDYNKQNDQKVKNDYDIDYNKQNDQKVKNDYDIDYNKQNNTNHLNLDKDNEDDNHLVDYPDDFDLSKFSDISEEDQNDKKIITLS